VTVQGGPKCETMTSVQRMSAITRGKRADRIPILTGMSTEFAGVLAAAWLVTVLPLVCLVVIYLFVPKPAPTQGIPPEEYARRLAYSDGRFDSVSKSSGHSGV
jgi:hypothetical protein